MASARPSTSYSTRTASTSYQVGYSTSLSQPARPSTSHTTRPSTATGYRSRAGSVIGGGEAQKIVCAISEGRGVSPIVGLAFVNISTGEAVLSQICDNQFFVKTVNKLQVFEPTEILIVSTSGPPNPKSKMYNIVEENILGAKIIMVDRRYWSEAAGLEYIDQLAFSEDVKAVKVAIGGNYFATCCFAAAVKYIDLSLCLTFAFHSLRIKYQASEGTMMIDLSTIQSLELIQNVQNSKSKHCLFGLLNHTLTFMGARALRSSILQPSTQEYVLSQRYDALDELNTKEDMFAQVRQALKSFQDIEKLLTSVCHPIDPLANYLLLLKLIIIPNNPDIRYSEQSINNILMLKSFVQGIPAIFEALTGSKSVLLALIRQHCGPENISPTLELIADVINEDVTYQKTSLDLRNQRTYAVKSGVSGLLDVARTTFKEATADVHQHVTDINQRCEMQAETKWENSRRYFLRISESDFEGRSIPDVLINRFRKKGYLECQTLDLIKLNQKIENSHQEVVLMSDQTIAKLLDDIRGEIPALFRVCESIAMLDMIASFGQMITTKKYGEYVRPVLTNCIAVKAGRHAVREMAHKERFIPNDVYATQQTRFQIITGCNMSGKSTYIRSIALMAVMAQIGCYVPADHASFPLIHQLFARVSMDDSIEANVSTFAAEMRETAFILRNINKNSMAIFDELGRGTSSRDGLAIALSIAEALVESGAMVWFATHFRELAQIMSQRPGVVNMHLAVDTSEHKTMTMLYKITQGFVQEEHYGLALARVVNLPAEVLEVAEEVSQVLKARMEAKKRSSKALAVAKRRKAILALREALKEAESGTMSDKNLSAYLRKLQEVFVRRMEDIETEAAVSDADSEADEEERSQSRLEDEEQSGAQIIDQ